MRGGLQLDSASWLMHPVDVVVPSQQSESEKDENATDRKRVDTIIRQAGERINYRFDFVFIPSFATDANCVPPASHIAI